VRERAEEKRGSKVTSSVDQVLKSQKFGAQSLRGKEGNVSGYTKGEKTSLLIIRTLIKDISLIEETTLKRGKKREKPSIKT